MSIDPPPRTPLRLAIVEDESLFRELLGTVLSALPGLTVEAAYGSASEALAELPAKKPDVVLLDIDLKNGENGFQLGLKLRKHLPQLGVVLLSSHRAPALLATLPVDQAHGWSYLLKSSVRDVESLERALHGTASGMMILDPKLAEEPGRNPLASQLSPRQYSLLKLLAEGKSNREISRQLHLTEKTVENQIGGLYREMGIDTSDSRAHSRVQATLRFIQGV